MRGLFSGTIRADFPPDIMHAGPKWPGGRNGQGARVRPKRRHSTGLRGSFAQRKDRLERLTD